jgi:serine/threonine protein kinase
VSFDFFVDIVNKQAYFKKTAAEIFAEGNFKIAYGGYNYFNNEEVVFLIHKSSAQVKISKNCVADGNHVLVNSSCDMQAPLQRNNSDNDTFRCRSNESTENHRERPWMCPGYKGFILDLPCNEGPPSRTGSTDSLSGISRMNSSRREISINKFWGSSTGIIDTIAEFDDFVVQEKYTGTLDHFVCGNDLSKEKFYLELRNILNDILAGLNAIHMKNIVHRDIKPDNILYRWNGSLKRMQGVISDFGSACRLKNDSAIEEINSTPAYSAPELYSRQSEWISTKVDIWSLGVMLLQIFNVALEVNPFELYLKAYEITTPEVNKGALPLIKMSLNISRKNLPAAEVKYLESYPEPSTGTLEHLIWQCLRLNPDARPSLEEIRNAFVTL